MNIIMKLFKRIDFKGRLTLSDSATKNGMSVAIYVMKNKDTFSKYQDYGFNIQEDNIERLIEIKHEIKACVRTDLIAQPLYVRGVNKD